jgi:hypothetical protein
MLGILQHRCLGGPERPGSVEHFLDRHGRRDADRFANPRGLPATRRAGRTGPATMKSYCGFKSQLSFRWLK